MTVQVDVEMDDADRLVLDEIARQTGEPLGRILTEAAEARAAEHAVLVRLVEEAEASVRSGDVYSYDEVVAHCAARRARLNAGNA